MIGSARKCALVVIYALTCGKCLISVCRDDNKCARMVKSMNRYDIAIYAALVCVFTAVAMVILMFPH